MAVRPLPEQIPAPPSVPPPDFDQDGEKDTRPQIAPDLLLATSGGDLGPLFTEFSGEDETSSHHRWKFWLAVLILSLLIHVLFFASRGYFWQAERPSRYEVQEIDPAKLDQIRKQWKEPEKFALGKKDQPETEEPKNARYASDKNRSVEKEQRARNYAPAPVPGDASRVGPEGQAPKSQPKPKQEARPKSQTTPLSNLGVPLKLSSKPPKPEVEETPPDQKTRDESQTVGNAADQYIDDGLPVGSQNILNTRESIYYSFYARIYEQVGPNWSSLIREVPYHQQVSPGEYTAVVDVVLDEDGNLRDITFLRFSGVREFDDAITQAWKKIQRFPNPPKGLLNEKGEVHMSWKFTVDASAAAGFSSGPPRRVQ